MPMILIGEGQTDVAVFRHLFGREFPGGLDVVLENSEGKYQTSDLFRELLGTGVLELVVSQDIDGLTPEATTSSLLNMVCSHLQVPAPSDSSSSSRFAIANRTFDIIPVGLYDDPTLGSIGVREHALEDYLIKLMLEDPSLRAKIPELQPLLLEILPPIRD